MNVLNSAVLINLLGFTVGVALYALLLVMVIRYRRKDSEVDLLLLTTAGLGLLWNTGELFELFYRDFFQTSVSPMLSAVSFSALGFLPSVVVNSAEKSKNKFGVLTVTAYALSFFAAVIHFQSAIFYNFAPSNFALKVLSFGSIALLAGLLFYKFQTNARQKSGLGKCAVDLRGFGTSFERRSDGRKFVACRTRRASIFASAGDSDSFAGLSFCLCRSVFKTRCFADLARASVVRFICFCRVAAPSLSRNSRPQRRTGNRFDLDALDGDRAHLSASAQICRLAG